MDNLILDNELARIQEARHQAPYSYEMQTSDFDFHLFSEGRHRYAYRFLNL